MDLSGRNNSIRRQPRSKSIAAGRAVPDTRLLRVPA